MFSPLQFRLLLQSKSSWTFSGHFQATSTTTVLTPTASPGYGEYYSLTACTTRRWNTVK